MSTPFCELGSQERMYSRSTSESQRPVTSSFCSNSSLSLSQACGFRDRVILCTRLWPRNFTRSGMTSARLFPRYLNQAIAKGFSYLPLRCPLDIPISTQNSVCSLVLQVESESVRGHRCRCTAIPPAPRSIAIPLNFSQSRETPAIPLKI